MAVKQYRVCDGCAKGDEQVQLAQLDVRVPQRRITAEDDSTVAIGLDLCAACLVRVVRRMFRDAQGGEVQEARNLVLGWVEKVRSGHGQ